MALWKGHKSEAPVFGENAGAFAILKIHTQMCISLDDTHGSVYKDFTKTFRRFI